MHLHGLLLAVKCTSCWKVHCCNEVPQGGLLLTGRQDQATAARRHAPLGPCNHGVSAGLQVVLDVLGAMIELVEALACQRLALAPFTRQGANAAAGTAAAAAGQSAAPSGLLRVNGHCYSVWAQPLHPVWLQVGLLRCCKRAAET
jgi:hypothetical protein